jgi:transcription initiation factor TFIIF subunit beta
VAARSDLLLSVPRPGSNQLQVEPAQVVQNALTMSTLPLDMDLDNAQRGVWLVKVPKWLSDRWESSAEGTDLGKVRIARRPNQKPVVSFTLTDELAAARAKGQDQEHEVGEGHVMSLGRTNKEVPKEHHFIVQPVAAQALAVFSHTSSAKTDSAGAGGGDEPEPLLPPGPDRLALEGKVVQRAECRPTSDELDMSLKREAIIGAIESARKTKQLEKAVATDKPKSYHQANVHYALPKKLKVNGHVVHVSD